MKLSVFDWFNHKTVNRRKWEKLKIGTIENTIACALIVSVCVCGKIQRVEKFSLKQRDKQKTEKKNTKNNNNKFASEKSIEKMNGINNSVGVLISTIAEQDATNKTNNNDTNTLDINTNQIVTELNNVDRYTENEEYSTGKVKSFTLKSFI